MDEDSRKKIKAAYKAGLKAERDEQSSFKKMYGPLPKFTLYGSLVRR